MKEERIFLVQKMPQLNNRTLVKRAWRSQCRNKNAPADSTINYLMKKFNHMGIVNDKPPKQDKMSEKKAKWNKSS